MPRRLAVTALALTLLFSGCGDDKKAPSKTTDTAPAETTAPETEKTDAAGCVIVEAPEPKGPGDLDKPKLKLSPKSKASVKLDTNCGEIVIALDVKRAPKTTSSFAALAQDGFFDGLTFHRIVADFVIQGGDPLGNGQGGPGYNIVEKAPSDLRYTRGVVAMAKSNVDASGTSGSQFFIVTGEDAGLTPDYALVGKVTAGMATVDKIASQPVNAQSLPLSPVVIESATFEEG